MSQHQRHSHQHHDHQPAAGPDQHRFLDLDAEVFGEQLAAVLDLAGFVTAHHIVDLGAGTGAGSRLLRGRYPDATVTCVDNDPQMLELLRKQGFGVIQADLDDGFPASTSSAETIDLVWASSSLHHVANPAQLLSGFRQALAPNGVLIVVELTDLPSFLSGPSDRQLEQRCHSAAAAAGWNHHPDWAPVIEAAGFRVTKTELTTDAPVTPAAREYAQQWFSRFAQLAVLTADDRNDLEALGQRLPDDLAPQATRTVWVCTSEQL